MTTHGTRGWVQKIRELCKQNGHTHNRACERLAAKANGFGGPPIRANNLYTFVKDAHPTGEALSHEKLERVGLALGYCLELVPENSVMVRKQDLKAIAADLEKSLERVNTFIQ